MARKHLLSFLFCLMATYFGFLYLENHRRRDLLFILLCYTLSIFSQPISLLWGLWFVLYLKFIKQRKLHLYKVLITCLVLIFTTGFTVNYLYYEKSDFFKFIFPSKTVDAFDMVPKIYSLGQYFFNIFFPYRLVFYYPYELYRILFGYLFFFIFSSLYLIKTQNYKNYVIWILFSLFPLSIILNTPRLMMDVYLLLPSVGFFVLAYDLFLKVEFKFNRYLLIPMFLFFSLFSMNESLLWTDPIKWGEMNSTRAPSCNGIVRHARELLGKGKVPQPDIMNYIFQNNCFHFESKYNQLEMIFFESQLLFYNKSIPLSEKENILRKHASINFFPLAVLAAIYVENQLYEKANKTLDEVTEMLKGSKFNTTAYDAIFDKVLMPYCQRIRHEGCIRFSSVLSVERDTPYF